MSEITINFNKLISKKDPKVINLIADIHNVVEYTVAPFIVCRNKITKLYHWIPYDAPILDLKDEFIGYRLEGNYHILNCDKNIFVDYNGDIYIVLKNNETNMWYKVLLSVRDRLKIINNTLTVNYTFGKSMLTCKLEIKQKLVKYNDRIYIYYMGQRKEINESEFIEYRFNIDVYDLLFLELRDMEQYDFSMGLLYNFLANNEKMLTGLFFFLLIIIISLYLLVMFINIIFNTTLFIVK